MIWDEGDDIDYERETRSRDFKRMKDMFEVRGYMEGTTEGRTVMENVQNGFEEAFNKSVASLDGFSCLLGIVCALDIFYSNNTNLITSSNLVCLSSFKTDLEKYINLHTQHHHHHIPSPSHNHDTNTIPSSANDTTSTPSCSTDGCSSGEGCCKKESPSPSSPPSCNNKPTKSKEEIIVEDLKERCACLFSELRLNIKIP
eukprot:TRINITY_DN2642_c0_g1_i4.p1 TRINITY_DN2642_c0_g1~~TRINITY_DN2642_c0_g1_i4.p1  ORF type:complete len:200 (+),score=71.03 TRINITY_DN2642_c0_g1_i4:149-748(+)